MYCIKCGQQLPDEAQFCCSCGAKTAQPTPTDEISAKASDFVMNEDISMSGGDLNNDRIAKEATLFGDFPSEPQSQIAFVPPLPPKPKRTTPEYNFSRTQSNDDPDLWIVRRDDDLLGLHECRLENKQRGLVSDWFDDIYYDCNGFYVIRKGSSRGLISKYITCASLWDRLCGYGSLNVQEHSICGFWGVCINDKWAIISLHNGEIKYHSPYVYDRCCVWEEDTIELKQGDLYGCLLFDEGQLKCTIPCILEDLDRFSDFNSDVGRVAKAKYKSQMLYLDRQGRLYKKRSFKLFIIKLSMTVFGGVIVWWQAYNHEWGESIFLDILYGGILAYVVFAFLYALFVLFAPDWELIRKIGR